ncbi:MAG: agmatine deiminase family protein [Proteobacteria bacterium]|nr:agmatine deiminase family protein [Pseudomonadota bacterium]
MTDPSTSGLRLPAEFERHAATWMAWPCREEIWADQMEAVRDDYARLARTIARFEPLRMVARAEHAADARRRCGAGIEVVEIAIDDSWTRDSGPIFLIDDAGGRVAASFRFTAWGHKYHPYADDAALAGRIAGQLEIPGIASVLALEGGAIISDGEGTLVTTESCLLHPNRNPGLSRAEIDAELRRVLKVEKVVWLPGDPTELETNGHVDGLFTYCAPARGLLERIDDPSDPRHAILAENRRALELATDARGRRIEFATIGEAPHSTTVGERYCRSYVNFYIVNGAVIAPAYGIAMDEQIAATLAQAFPEREIVMLPIGAIAVGGGGFHCITQQEPAPAFRGIARASSAT